MLRIITTLLLALSAVILTTGPVWAGDKTKTRILFIGVDPDHTYGTHMYMHTSTMLAKCVELTPGVQGVVSNGWPKDAKMLEGVKAICVYSRPAADLLLDGPYRAEFEALMKKGVGLVTIHWAVAINRKNIDRLGPAWFSYLGGSWFGPGTSMSKAPLKQLLKDHPLNRGWKEFDLEDEIYLNPVIKGGKPALQIQERKGTDVVVGWVHERPENGRSFGTTLGHFYKNFQNESFRRMIVNGILWTAHVEIPPQGAPVNVAEDILALPPKK